MSPRTQHLALNFEADPSGNHLILKTQVDLITLVASDRGTVFHVFWAIKV
jgi:hypothetical protein